MSNDNGGPAFPRPAGWNGLSNFEEHASNEEQDGMSLRDYFAAKALNGLLSCAADDYNARTNAEIRTAEERVQLAYHYADLMLKARLAE